MTPPKGTSCLIVYIAKAFARSATAVAVHLSVSLDGSQGRSHHWNKDPMYGCQIRTAYPLLHVKYDKKDKLSHIEFSGVPPHTPRVGRTEIHTDRIACSSKL
jgi:hypothetical protein